jgi:hypothetical protein
MDLTLDNSGLPYVAHSFGTSNNKLIHFNSSDCDLIGLDFHTGSISAIDMDVFQSSNKVDILFMIDLKLQQVIQ